MVMVLTLSQDLHLPEVGEDVQSKEIVAESGLKDSIPEQFIMDGSLFTEVHVAPADIPTFPSIYLTIDKDGTIDYEYDAQKYTRKEAFYMLYNALRGEYNELVLDGDQVPTELLDHLKRI
jgi:hypothetical protein